MLQKYLTQHGCTFTRGELECLNTLLRLVHRNIQVGMCSINDQAIMPGLNVTRIEIDINTHLKNFSINSISSGEI